MQSSLDLLNSRQHYTFNVASNIVKYMSSLGIANEYILQSGKEQVLLCLHALLWRRCPIYICQVVLAALITRPSQITRSIYMPGQCTGCPDHKTHQDYADKGIHVMYRHYAGGATLYQ